MPADPAPDLLGDGFTAETIPLPPDDEGDVVATLVRREPTDRSRHTGRAVLHLPGYNDYFFHRELADAWDGAGFAFHALDMRKAGRSLRPHQTPSFVRRLSDYAPELDEALRRVRAGGARTVVVSGHSTGGLVAALWLHHRRGRGDVQALVLNSPFLDLPGPWWERRVATAAGLLGGWRPYAVLPREAADYYARSLHHEHAGEWEFDLDLKQPSGLPTRLGWLGAVRSGHRAVRRGLDVGVPVLVLCAARSVRPREWTEDLLAADAVLDADRIAALARRLGPDVAVLRFAGGMHDLVLSARQVREQVYAETARWLGSRLPPSGAADAG